MRLLDTLSRSLTEMGELGARLGGRQGEELHERCAASLMQVQARRSYYIAQVWRCGGWRGGGAGESGRQKVEGAGWGGAGQKKEGRKRSPLAHQPACNLMSPDPPPRSQALLADKALEAYVMPVITCVPARIKPDIPCSLIPPSRPFTPSPLPQALLASNKALEAYVMFGRAAERVQEAQRRLQELGQQPAVKRELQELQHTADVAAAYRCEGEVEWEGRAKGREWRD